MKRVIAATLFFSTLAYPASRAAADDAPTSVSFNVSAGGFTFANRDKLKDNPVFDMRIGYDVIGNSILDSIGIEGGLSYISTQSRKDQSPVDAYLFRVDATYPFFPRSRVVPFATIGAGGMFMSRSTTLDKAPLLAYGLGIKYFVQEFIAVRADFRHNLLFDIHTRNDFQYMIGLSFLLDRDKKIRRLPLPPPPPKEKSSVVAPAVPVIEPEKPATAPAAAAPEKPAPAPVPIHLEPEQPKPQPEKEEPAALPMLLPLVPAAPIAIAADALAPAPVVESRPAPLAAEPKAAERQAQPEAVEAKPEPAAPAQSKTEPPPAPPVEPPPAPRVEPPPAPRVEPPPAPPVEPPPAPRVEPPPAPPVEPPPAPRVEPSAQQDQPAPAPRVKSAVTSGVEPGSASRVEPAPAPRVQLETPQVSPATPQVKIEQPYQLPNDGDAPQDQRPDEEVVASILCPDAPPAGSKPRELAADSATVLFDSGSAEVKPRFLPELKVIASFIKKHPQSSVYIEGHADNVGKPDYNMRLSKKRVASVKKSLTKTLGRAKAKIVTAAFGCRIPVDTNKKPDGRQKNRRATVEVKK